MKVQASEIKRRDYVVELTNTELKNIVAEHIQKGPLVLTPGAIKDKHTVAPPMQPALKVVFTSDGYHDVKAIVSWHEAIN